MSINTHGGNYDRGEGAFQLVPYSSRSGATATNVIIFPKNNLANPYIDTLSYASQCAIAYGNGRFVSTNYAGNPISRYWLHTTAPNNFVYPSGTWDNRWNYMQGNNTAIADGNYPYQLGFGNGIFMATCSTFSSIPGNIYVSSNGISWTKYSGVVPAYSGSVLAPVYNEDDGRWCFAIQNTTTFFYSDNDGASWTQGPALGATCFGLTYGNGLWVFGTGQTVTRSNGQFDEIIATSVGYNDFPVAWGIHYNKYDQRFWAASASVVAPISHARILWSTDAVTWNSSYNGTFDGFLTQVAGDDDGNMIAVGMKYTTTPSPLFIGTTGYLYSTDGGTSWNAGILPQAIGPNGGLTSVVYGSTNMGTPPAGAPPLPTYSLSVDRTEANEGDTINWTLYTTNITDGSILYYNYDPFPADGFSDFNELDYNGSFTVNSNTATFQKTITADSKTEGTETVTLNIRTGSVTGSILVASDTVTIYDTSVYVPPAPPPQAQPTITAGASQSFSVPRSVFKEESISYIVEYTNYTPYSYTVDAKYAVAYVGGRGVGDINHTFELPANYILTLTISQTFPTGYTAAAAPNWNFTLEADARGAPGTPNTYTINVSRTPYNVSVSPPSGSNVIVPNGTDIVFSGGEPNSYLSFTGTTSGTVQFDSSGSYTFYNLTSPNGQRQTASWTMTLSDGTSFPYSLNYI